MKLNGRGFVLCYSLIANLSSTFASQPERCWTKLLPRQTLPPSARCISLLRARTSGILKHSGITDWRIAAPHAGLVASLFALPPPESAQSVERPLSNPRLERP
jgi:hypothetical protein